MSCPFCSNALSGFPYNLDPAQFGYYTDLGGLAAAIPPADREAEMSKSNGGPAFPSHGSMGEVAHQGMSLREWYAGMAMKGTIAYQGPSERMRERARAAFEMADAMIAEGEK